jgi:periplasmic protein TonB
MRIIKLLPGLAFLFLGVASAAGQAAAVVPVAAAPATRLRYFNAAGKEVAKAAEADHREDQIFRDSVGGTVRIYYPSGKLRRIEPYLHFDYGIKYGAVTSFYETGEVKSRCQYNREGPVGYYVQYYRTGQVRFRNPQGLDLPLDAKSEAFGPDDQPYPEGHVDPKDKMPTLKGGEQNIVAAVQRAVRYPIAALRAQAMGQVFVSFMVDDAGFVRNVQIVSSPSPLLNPAVLTAVASLGRFVPGAHGGDPVDVFFTLPITFSIQ